MKKPIFSIVIIVIVILSVTSYSFAKSKKQSVSVHKRSPSGWTEYKNNPVIQYNDTVKGILWNDPSVIKEGSQYRMWLTGGKPFSPPIVVKVHEAHSDDGIKWNINPTPVLKPGKKGAWDDLRVETPTVIKVDDTYHLYYSGCKSPCNTGAYDIGHATSQDGTHWEKDPTNPVVRHHNDPLKWGFYTAAEPAIVHHEGVYYLYYTGAKSNYPKYGTPFGILLATSRDGSRFKKHGAAHTLTTSYDSKVYRGYSTPAVFVADGIFHLYHDVVYSPKNPDGFDQVAISSATSTDGFFFTEAVKNIIVVENDWKQTSVLAPTVLEDGGVTKMWFAGRRDKPKFGYGIGYATISR